MIGCLAWGRVVLVPLALAILLTFLLAPAASFLERGLGRVGAVLVVVVLASALLGAIAWGLGHQLSSLADELPRYRWNIRQKIADVRGVSRGGSLEKVKETVQEIQNEMAKDSPATPAVPVKPVGTAEPTDAIWRFPTALGPVLDALATAGLVVILVVFMLLERQELRSRCIRLFGPGQLAVATRGVDEAGRRISLYLSRQSLINGSFGVGAGVGLALLGVPYALLWGFLGAALRFLPYVGPWVAALGPILLSLAVFDGWTRPLLVVGLFVVLELVTNLVLETILYSGAAGVSATGLLVAIAFWTWLWGPLGLLLATPLTVCLMVLAKHVQGLETLSMLIGDEPVHSPSARFYERLMTADQDEAIQVVEQHVARHGPEAVYDEVVLPALAQLRRERVQGEASEDDERRLLHGVATILDDVLGDEPAPDPGSARFTFGVPTGHPVDDLALRGLGQLLARAGVGLRIVSDRRLFAEVSAAGVAPVVCVAAVPPGGLAAARYLVKRLRIRVPASRIVVGRWGLVSPEEGDVGTAALSAAGADQVTTRLLEARDGILAALEEGGRAAGEPAGPDERPASAVRPAAGAPA